jgi:hypothetical protein
MLRKVESEESSKKEISLCESMVDQIITETRRLASDDIVAFESAIARREEVTVLQAKYRTELAALEEALKKEKTTAPSKNIKDSLDKRRKLEHDISDLNLSIADLENQFIPPAEASIKEARDTIYASLWPIILKTKKSYQVQLDELFAAGNLIMAEFSKAVLMVSNMPEFNTRNLTESIQKDMLTDFNTDRAPQSAANAALQVHLRAEIIRANWKP